MNQQHSTSSPLICHHRPNLWLFTLKTYSHSPKQYSQPALKSLVNRSRFQQNGPASLHVRKEPAKNKFLVNFCFELTAQCLFSSDLPPPPKYVVYKSKALSIPPPKNPVPQDNSRLVSYLFYPHPQNHWLIRRYISRMGQPVNTSGRNQLKTSF